MADALEKINEVYEESVKEDNAERFKRAAEFIFEEIKYINLTPIDIKYENGYFIFDFGSNSVIHFHIKECPKWLFGIWFDIEENNTIKATIFAQHEDWIDKFKPSASSFSSCVHIYPNKTYKKGDLNYCEFIEMIKFIHRESIMAFFYHMNGLCQYKYVSKFKAWKFRIAFILDNKKEQRKYKKEKRMLDKWVKKHFDKFIKNHSGCSYKIVDFGECVKPRYEIEFCFPTNTTETDKVYKEFQKLKIEYQNFNNKFDNWIYANWITEVTADENN